MNEIVFGRLADLWPREAWPHEAHGFTPWLAANIEQLSEVVGIPLELTGTEVAIGPFSADILARNPEDGSAVLIENQLEVADHSHLGQILTYLAGLNAKTIIWIAPRFKEPHLSAIRWLNEHTADGISFFAVKLRVVRIAASPYAPIFEVLEKPNGWDRLIVAVRKQSNADNDLGTKRQAFWQTYLERYPEAATEGLAATQASSVWSAMPDVGLNIGLWVGKEKAGIFIRGGRGAATAETSQLLKPSAELLCARLGARWGGSDGRFLHRRLDAGLDDSESWPATIEWLEAARLDYRSVLSKVLAGGGYLDDDSGRNSRDV
jgi:hypothetical protein